MIMPPDPCPTFCRLALACCTCCDMPKNAAGTSPQNLTAEVAQLQSRDPPFCTRHVSRMDSFNTQCFTNSSCLPRLLFPSPPAWEVLANGAEKRAGCLLLLLFCLLQLC